MSRYLVKRWVYRLWNGTAEKLVQYNSTTAVLETSAVVNALNSERPLDTRRRIK